MDNPEYIFQILEAFSKLKSKEIPRELEEFISYVARTGDPVYQWTFVKVLLKEKLLAVLNEFHESNPSLEIPHCPNVDPFNFESMKSHLLNRLDSFAYAPFTIQRICELLSAPRKEYNRIDKYMRAIEKNVLVVTTREVCLKRAMEADNSSDPVVNGIFYTKVNNFSNHNYSEDNEIDDEKLSAPESSMQGILSEWNEENTESGFKITDNQTPVDFQTEINFDKNASLTEEMTHMKTESEDINVSAEMDTCSFIENESLEMEQDMQEQINTDVDKNHKLNYESKNVIFEKIDNAKESSAVENMITVDDNEKVTANKLFNEKCSVTETEEKNDDGELEKTDSFLIIDSVIDEDEMLYKMVDKSEHTATVDGLLNENNNKCYDGPQKCKELVDNEIISKTGNFVVIDSIIEDKPTDSFIHKAEIASLVQQEDVTESKNDNSNDFTASYELNQEINSNVSNISNIHNIVLECQTDVEETLQKLSNVENIIETTNVEHENDQNDNLNVHKSESTEIILYTPMSDKQINENETKTTDQLVNESSIQTVITESATQSMSSTFTTEKTKHEEKSDLAETSENKVSERSQCEEKLDEVNISNKSAEDIRTYPKLEENLGKNNEIDVITNLDMENNLKKNIETEVSKNSENQTD